MTHSKPSTGFRPARRLRAGPLLAIAVSSGLALWMATGPAVQPAVSSVADTSDETRPQSVRVVTSMTAPYSRPLVLEGETRPAARATVINEIAGPIRTLHAANGARLDASALIAEITLPDLEAREAEAAARLDEAERALERSQALSAKGFATQARLEAAITASATAEADVAGLRRERAQAQLTAPIAGTLHDLDAEIGAYIPQGAAIGEVLDLSRLIVEVAVPQQDAALIAPGDNARVILATGEDTIGTVRHAALIADPATRTFLIEVEIDNANHDLRAGVSASAEFLTDVVNAHRVPIAFLSLDDNGRTVVKTVEGDQVQIWPVQIEGSEAGDVFVSGLPESASIITVGQGFVRSGDRVDPVLASDERPGQ